MQAIRQIYQIAGDSLTIPIPESFRHHQLEVILLPIGEEQIASWPIGFLDKFAGCMADDPLTRASQGSYGTRDVLK